MASPPRFDDLALKYVLADKDGEEDQHRAVSEQAAEAIENSTNKRLTVGQWVASVSRWMQSSGEDDLISRARALDFLASTLQILSRRDDTLNADQVRLLVTFFCSLFENDHKAGITASSKALRHLIATKHFQPTLGNDIAQSVCKLQDDFKLQTPTTRLEIYHLFRDLLKNPGVAHDLENRYGSTGKFVLELLTLCRNERDPDNLMMWFSILTSLLLDFTPSVDVTSEIFKAFSAYFPISLRPSATPSSVTTDHLKVALRSCFSAHWRMANFSIPFLVEKLDKVDQTVAVKVDILLTLDACLMKYEDPKQSIVPYADLIWSSLKYEVRNGDIQDIIKATLGVLCSLTKRLEGRDLELFVDNAWRDLKEDISDSKYTAQAGRLLVAIVGATPDSFSLLIPRAFDHVKNSIRHNTSGLHKRHLIALMSSVAKLRLHLVSHLDPILYQSGDRDPPLSDDLFGDPLFHDFYLPFWEEHFTVDNINILQEAMQGMGALVGQKSSGKGPIKRLCSDSTCETIFNILAKLVIICPLKGIKYFDSSDDTVPQDLLDAGEEALKAAVPLYPPSFPYLLSQYITTIQDAYQSERRPRDLGRHIQMVSATLCSLIRSDSSKPYSSWLNEVALVSTSMQGLQWMLSKAAEPELLIVFIDAIHVAFFLASKDESKHDNDAKLTKEQFTHFAQLFEIGNFPQASPIEIDKQPESEDAGSRCARLAFRLFVVQQLYRLFTIPADLTLSNSESINIVKVPALRESFTEISLALVTREDMLLNRLGQMATSVISTFSESEQRALELDSAAFTLFHSWNEVSMEQLVTRWRISPANNYRTAPFTLGIIQGLWPGAIRSDIHISALADLEATLLTTTVSCSDAARSAMDTLFCVLSNKLDIKKNNEFSDKRMQLQASIIAKIEGYINHPDTIVDTISKLRIFRSVINYLAGDVVRPITGPGNNNLLNFIIANGTMDFTLGRRIAQSLGLIIATRNCLDKLYHPIRKILAMGWFFHESVVPYLDRCLPHPGITEREAINHAVGTFAILQHMDYKIYASEVTKLVRIGIQSLSTFKVGVETESLLVVLQHVLEEDPDELRGHLVALVQGLLTVHEMARNGAAEIALSGPNKRKISDNTTTTTSSAHDRMDPFPTCMYTLRLLQKLTECGYEARILLPHRRTLVRRLAAACGDPVRELRRTAIKAREAWEGLN